MRRKEKGAQRVNGIGQMTENDGGRKKREGNLCAQGHTLRMEAQSQGPCSGNEESGSKWGTWALSESLGSEWSGVKCLPCLHVSENLLDQRPPQHTTLLSISFSGSRHSHIAWSLCFAVGQLSRKINFYWMYLSTARKLKKSPPIY